MSEQKIYTISDIAQELGVSKTTVSRALSGKGRIGRETKERIFALAKQHDYQPNAQARGLVQNRTCNIGMIIPYDYSLADFPFFKECMSGICETASAYNYDIVISMSNGQDFSNSCRLIANHKVDGMILSRSTVEALEMQRYLKEKQMPFVVIGQVEDKDVAWVDNKNREGSRELTSILLWKGMHRLALFSGSRDHLVTESRLQGFLDAHHKQGIKVDESLIFYDTDNFPAVTEALGKVIEKGIDGIVCMDDYIMGMLLAVLNEKNIRVPEDIKLATLYDNIRFELFTPTVTGLRFNTKGLGKNACIKLLKLLGEDVTEEAAALDYQVILRQSTK